jgi:hypothetical protein
MAMGTRKRRERQQELWIATVDVVETPGNAFYDRLNAILDECKFDVRVEHLCRGAAVPEDERGAVHRTKDGPGVRAVIPANSVIPQGEVPNTCVRSFVRLACRPPFLYYCVVFANALPSGFASVTAHTRASRRARTDEDARDIRRRVGNVYRDGLVDRIAARIIRAKEHGPIAAAVLALISFDLPYSPC